jgi:hypothetical protein
MHTDKHRFLEIPAQPNRSPEEAKDISPVLARRAEAVRRRMRAYAGKTSHKTFPRPSDGRGWHEVTGEDCSRPDEGRREKQLTTDCADYAITAWRSFTRFQLSAFRISEFAFPTAACADFNFYF